MKSQILLAVLIVVAFSSCSTAYKSSQTPDDVYYSPAKETEEYVEIKQSSNNDRYRNYEYDNTDDRWLRMRVRNPYRWNAFDDYDWNLHSGWTNNYSNPYSYNWNNYWNGYYNWNSGYNPYCRNVVVINPKSYPNVYTKVRNFSLNSYTNNNYGNNNLVTRNAKSSTRLPNSGYGSYNNSNNNAGNSLGTSIRKVFSGSNSGYSNTNTNSNSGSSSSSDRSSRSYTPSSSSGSSSGSSSQSSGSSGGSSSSGGTSSGRRGG